MLNPNPVVSNTTPLISLGEVGLLDVFHQLYGELWVPQAVFDEYQVGIPAHPQRPNLTR
jgi:predicted nucleic acid-binding protein